MIMFLAWYWRKLATLLLAVLLVLLTPQRNAADELIPPDTDDPHYNIPGFFDLHVCNWPDRAEFFLAVFSTYRFEDVSHAKVFAPDGESVGKFNLERYRIIRKNDKPEKRAFLSYMNIPKAKPDGWYSAEVTMNDGKRYLFKDYVVLVSLERPRNLHPVDGAELPVPDILSWNPVPGAKYYRLFLWDQWDDGEPIFESGLLTEPRLRLPKGLLKAGGDYQWRVHARDVNEHPLLGDFNHGSLSPKISFSTLPLAPEEPNADQKLTDTENIQ